MPTLGLRARFLLYSNALIVVTMSLVAVLAVIHERRSWDEAMLHRGRSTAEMMAIAIAGILDQGDGGGVSRAERVDGLLEEVMLRDGDGLRYAAVADGLGRVSQSVPPELIGQKLERRVPADSPGEHGVAHTRPGAGGERVLEVLMPLRSSTGFRGTLAVGYSFAPADRRVRAIAWQVGLVSIVLLVGNSCLTGLYVETLIRPILSLHQSMKRAGEGDLEVRAGSRRRDEVAELADAFNHMMVDLEEARGQEEVRQAELAHTEKMAAVGTLAAGVAHEVLNPVAGILTGIENMRANPGDRRMRERYLELIRDGVERIERTVAKLLDFARQRETKPEPTSINDSLRRVTELLEYQLRKGQIEVQFDLADEDPVVMADRFQMEQLFLNLMLNAAQAMPEGGALTVRTRSTDGSLVVEIRDTGIGIPEENLNRVFDPFFTTRHVDQGTGLGLAVSHSIVAAHGATIEVESTVGEGSAFFVSLPVNGDQAGRPEAS